MKKLLCACLAALLSSLVQANGYDMEAPENLCPALRRLVHLFGVNRDAGMPMAEAINNVRAAGLPPFLRTWAMDTTIPLVYAHPRLTPHVMSEVTYNKCKATFVADRKLL